MDLQPLTSHELQAQRTTHAMLVPWGLFAQYIGLIEELAKVPIPRTAIRRIAREAIGRPEGGAASRRADCESLHW